VGKGSRYRPIDKAKFDLNMDRIFGEKPLPKGCPRRRVRGPQDSDLHPWQIRRPKSRSEIMEMMHDVNGPEAKAFVGRKHDLRGAPPSKRRS